MKKITSLIIITLPLLLSNCGQHEAKEEIKSKNEEISTADKLALTLEDSTNLNRLTELTISQMDGPLSESLKKELADVKKYCDSIDFKIPKLSEADKLKLDERAKHVGDSIAKTMK